MAEQGTVNLAHLQAGPLPHRIVGLPRCLGTAIPTKFLTRKGFLIEEQGMTYVADTDPDLAFRPVQAAACTYRIALGLRAGQKELSLQTVPSVLAPNAKLRTNPQNPAALRLP